MDSELLTVFVTLAIAALAIAAAYAVQYAARRPELGEVSEAASLLVQAAEQMLADRDGREKLAWVYGELGRRFKHIDGALLRALIEASVYRMNGDKAAAQTAQTDAPPAPPAGVKERRTA